VFALLLPILGSFLEGCAAEHKVIINDVATPRARLDLSYPDPVKLDDPQWIVLTQNNYTEIMKNLKAEDPNGVLLAVSPDDYKSISVNNFVIRQYVEKSTKIIDSYKSYYEPAVPPLLPAVPK
jgi:hypothetical protein